MEGSRPGDEEKCPEIDEPVGPGCDPFDERSIDVEKKDLEKRVDPKQRSQAVDERANSLPMFQPSSQRGLVTGRLSRRGLRLLDQVEVYLAPYIGRHTSLFILLAGCIPLIDSDHAYPAVP